MSKNAIITGGSRGIGKAMALKLGELGYNVAINYRSDSSKQLTEDLVEEIKSEYGVEAIAVQADVSVFEDCKKLVEATVEVSRSTMYGRVKWHMCIILIRFVFITLS